MLGAFPGICEKQIDSQQPDTTKDMQRGLLGIEGNAGGIPGNLREAN